MRKERGEFLAQYSFPNMGQRTLNFSQNTFVKYSYFINNRRHISQQHCMFWFQKQLIFCIRKYMTMMIFSSHLTPRVGKWSHGSCKRSPHHLSLKTVVVLRVLLSEYLVPPTELYGRGAAAFWILECGTHWQVCSSVDAPTTSEPGRNRKANGSHKYNTWKLKECLQCLLPIKLCKRIGQNIFYVLFIHCTQLMVSSLMLSHSYNKWVSAKAVYCSNPCLKVLLVPWDK